MCGLYTFSVVYRQERNLFNIFTMITLTNLRNQNISVELVHISEGCTSNLLLTFLEAINPDNKLALPKVLVDPRSLEYIPSLLRNVETILCRFIVKTNFTDIYVLLRKPTSNYEMVRDLSPGLIDFFMH